MKKRVIIIILIIVLLIILWLGMVFTDYFRCSNFEEPLFAKATFSTDFGYGDGRKYLEYKGLGYNYSYGHRGKRVIFKGRIPPILCLLRNFSINICKKL